jgi:hypothetical protein
VPSHGGITPGKYQPLVVHLANLAEDCVTLTLAEVEAILGFCPPPKSRVRAFWIEKARTWNRAGWRYVPPPPSRHKLTMPPLRAVTFVRVDV